MDNKMVISKEVEGYRTLEEDFQMEGELMVTITLHEYRSLVNDRASSQTSVRYLEQAKEELQRKLKEKEDELKLMNDKNFMEGWKYVVGTNVGEDN